MHEWGVVGLYNHTWIHVMLSLRNIAGKRREKPMNSSQPLLLLSSSQQPLLTDRMESQWWKEAGSEQRAQDGHIGGANGKSSVVCLEPFNTVAVFLYRVMDGLPVGYVL